MDTRHTSRKTDHTHPEQLIRYYLDQFDYCSPRSELLVSLSKDYDQFLSDLQNNIEQGQTSMSMLFGQHGRGKKCCVKYALHHLAHTHDISLVDVDATLFHDENTLFRQIINRIKAHDTPLFQQIQAKQLNETPSFSKLIEKINVSKKAFIIQIDNFQELVKTKRQALLYKILNLLNEFQSSLQLVAITNHAFLQDLFEKRISSRFTAKTYSFYSASPDSYLRVLHRRSQVNKNIPQIQTINEKMGKIFENPQVISYLRNLIEEKAPYQDISVLLSITQLALSFIEPSFFFDFDSDSLSDMLLDEYRLLVKSRSFDQLQFMLTQLTKPQLQVLLFVRKLQKEGKKNVNFEEVLNLEQRYGHSLKVSFNIGSSQRFSREVLMGAFSHLLDYQLLQVQQEHSQNTQRNFSNANITILVHEQDLVAFENKATEHTGDALTNFLAKP